jgi:hypothetical protein
VVSTHFYRQRAGAVVTIDPRRFEEKERHAIGKARLVVALSHWGNEIGLKRFVPRRFHKDVEWAWCTHPVLTSGVYAIEWAAQQGCTEIYTMGVDLTPGYHKRLDTQRSLLARTLSALEAKGVRVYKRSPASTLPVPVRDPAEHLPEGAPRPGPAPRGPSPTPSVALRRLGRHRPVPAAAPERRVLLRPRNGKPRIVHVSDLPRS